MIVLALPGLIMLEAEWMAFEILTLLTSQFGAEYLAAQSVLMTVATVAFYIPFPVAIAASTRIANLIGAKLVDAAKMSAKVVCFSLPDQSARVPSRLTTASRHSAAASSLPSSTLRC